jgi:hypothetical protein
MGGEGARDVRIPATPKQKCFEVIELFDSFKNMGGILYVRNSELCKMSISKSL